jgi:hypothetical protein
MSSLKLSCPSRASVKINFEASSSKVEINELGLPRLDNFKIRDESVTRVLDLVIEARDLIRELDSVGVVSK